MNFLLLPIMVSLLGFTFFQSEETYKYRYKSKDCIVYYSYELNNDSLRMVGMIWKKKTNEPVVGMNIQLMEYRVGTVSNGVGKFSLLLIKREGKLFFHLTEYTNFELPFSIKDEDLTGNYTSPNKY